MKPKRQFRHAVYERPRILLQIDFTAWRTANGCYSNDGFLFPNEESHLSALKSVNVWNTLSNKGSYYSSISGSAYVLGWDDVQDEVTSADALDLRSSTRKPSLVSSSENLKPLPQAAQQGERLCGYAGVVLRRTHPEPPGERSGCRLERACTMPLLYRGRFVLDNIHFNGIFVPTTSFTAVTLSLDF